MEEEIIAYINSVIRPMSKADGGDLLCTHIDGSKLHITASGDCATCRSCDSNLEWWINKKIKKRFNKEFHIQFHYCVPYFDL